MQTLAPALRQLSTRYDSTAAEAAEGVVHLLKFRDGYTGRNLISLFDALVWSRRALATDPRDKIFALLGLCHDGATFVPVPNYKQGLGTTIADMSRAMMSLNKSLDCIYLRGAKNLSVTQNLPSWAPNWPSIWSNKLTVQEEDIIKLPWKTHDCKPILASNNDFLRVKGVYFGRVTSLAPAFGRSYSNGAANTHSGWILSTSTLREVKPELIVDGVGSATKEAIWKTLVMSPRYLLNEDIYKSTYISPSVYDCFEMLWKPEGRGAVEDLNLIRWIDDIAWFAIGSWTLREWSQVKHRKDIAPPKQAQKSPFNLFSSRSGGDRARTKDETTQGISINASNSTKAGSISSTSLYLTALIQSLHEVLSSGMRLVCTDFHARCPVAMAHPDVEAGDVIYYLDGCERPVILRRSGSGIPVQYKVIGGCHLIGARIENKFVVSLEDSHPFAPSRILWTRVMVPIEIDLV
ncbi:hypothetical protein V8E51_014046 [Hyaloscypha variabilis]